MSSDSSFLKRLEDRNAADTPPRGNSNGNGHTPSTPLTDNEQRRRRTYAEAALRKECDRVAYAADGTRNDTLNSAAFAVNRFIENGILDRDEVEDALYDAARNAGLPDHEILRTLNSAATGSANKARTNPVPPPTQKYNPIIVATPPKTIAETPQTNGQNHDQNNGLNNGLDMHPIWGSHHPIDGGAYLFDHEEKQVALWGQDEQILWAEGEALMIAGGMGLGKTTLAGQLLRAQLGLDPQVLDLPVMPVDTPILYLAMDRPRQIRRSLLRQFDPTERHYIENKLLIRPGPPIADLAVRPTLIAEMAEDCGAGYVYLDSLKDAAIGLSSDEVGAAYNRSRQFALAQNVQVCELHHLVKRNALGGAPMGVMDVYGSTWLTAGAGSVIMLTGDPGDPIVSFRHTKQPFAEVGPYHLLHDHEHGLFSISHQVDLVALAAAAGPQGLTAKGAAANLFDKENPTRADVEKARRKLEKLHKTGHLAVCPDPSGQGSYVYFPAS